MVEQQAQDPVGIPSPELQGLLASAQPREVPIAIVSNNSEAAVRVFLDRFEWTSHLKVLACRTPETTALMKPDAHLVTKAARLVHVDPGKCVLIGDSVSDVRAGQAAGVRVIGLAKTPVRGNELATAGADALISR